MRMSFRSIRVMADVSSRAWAQDGARYAMLLADAYGADVRVQRYDGLRRAQATASAASPTPLDGSLWNRQRSALHARSASASVARDPASPPAGNCATPAVSPVSDDEADLVISVSDRPFINAIRATAREEEPPLPLQTFLSIGPNVNRSLLPRHILHAVDFSPYSLAASRYVFSLAQQFQARVTSMNVVDAEVPLPAAEAAVRRWMKKLAPPEATLWCDIRTVVDSGYASDRLLHFSDTRDVSLVVAGLCGLDGSGRPGFTTRALLRYARCPVLVAQTAVERARYFAVRHSAVIGHNRPVPN